MATTPERNWTDGQPTKNEATLATEIDEAIVQATERKAHIEGEVERLAQETASAIDGLTANCAELGDEIAKLQAARNELVGDGEEQPVASETVELPAPPAKRASRAKARRVGE